MIPPRMRKLTVSTILLFSSLLSFAETRISYVVVGDDIEARGRIHDLLAYYIEGSPEYTYIDFEDHESVVGSELELIDRFGLDLLLELRLTSEESTIVISSDVYGTDLVDPILSSVDRLSAEEFADYSYLHSHLVSRLQTYFDYSSWGALYLDNHGEDGPYDLFVDGRFAGSDLETISVPPGNPVVMIRQVRPFGIEILAEEVVEVRSGATTQLSFAVPEMTALERSAFERLEETVRTSWDEKDLAGDTISEALALLGRSAGSERLTTIADRFRTLNLDLQNGSSPTTFPTNPYISQDSGVVDEVAPSADQLAAAIAATEAQDDGATLGAAEPDAAAPDATAQDATSISTGEEPEGVDTRREEPEPAESKADEPDSVDTVDDENDADLATGEEPGDVESTTGESRGDETSGEAVDESGDGESNPAIADDKLDGEIVESPQSRRQNQPEREVLYTVRETGLFGPSLRAEFGQIFTSLANVALDLGANAQLFDPTAWDNSSPGWGADISSTFPQRAIVDYGGNYFYFAVAAGSAQSLSLLLDTLLFPYRRHALSTGGKLIKTTGRMIQAGGAVLGLFGRDLSFDSMLLERELIDAETPSPELNTLYRQKFTSALSLTLASYAAFGVGTILNLAAPAATGNASQVMSGFGQGLLHTFSSLLGTSGSLAAYLALLFRAESEYRYDRFEEDPSNTTLYGQYTESVTYYRYSIIASLSLIGASALTEIVAMLLPPGKEKTAVSIRPYLSPAPGYVTVGFEIGAKP